MLAEGSWEWSELDVGWRVAAAWALIGFACQCFLAFWLGLDLVEGLQRAVVHYLAWGVAGLFIGSVVERSIEESLHRRIQRRHTVDRTPAPSKGAESTS